MAVTKFCRSYDSDFWEERSWRLQTGSGAHGEPFVQEVKLPVGIFRATELKIRITDDSGGEIVSYQPRSHAKGNGPSAGNRAAAAGESASKTPTNCLSPACTSANTVTPPAVRLFTGGKHCAAIRWIPAVTMGWASGICAVANGIFAMKGFPVPPSNGSQAGMQILMTAGRITTSGLCLRFQLDANPSSALRDSQFEDAYTACFTKATWNQALGRAGFHALAELDCRRGDWARALEHA